MAAPTVVSTDPASSETNVFINRHLTVVFSEAIDSDTISGNSVYLTHQTSAEREYLQLSLSDDGITLTIIPNRVLDKNETYILTLIGTDTGLTYIIASDTSDELASTVYTTFTTGDDVEQYAGEKTDLEFNREGDLRLPADIKVVPGERLEVEGTTPEHHSSGLAITTDQILTEFSADINASSLTSTSMQVNIRAIFGMDDYLAKDRGDGTIVFAIDDPEYPAGTDVDFDDPTGTISTTGEFISWDRDSTDFLYNTEVEVLLSSDITDDYGNMLVDVRRFVFVTQAYPMFSSVYGVERELPTLPEAIDRDLIYALIWRNSIRAYELSGKASPPSKAYWAYRQYAHARTCLDILDNAEIPRSILAGVSKQLGDFQVSWGREVGQLGLKYRTLKGKLEEAEIALKGFRNSFGWAIKSGSYNRDNFRTRTWTRYSSFNTSRNGQRPITENIPAANTVISRASSLPGSLDGWS